MFYLIFCAFIVSLVQGQFTLANTAKSLSSYQTLASGISYELNFTLSRVITAGSTLSLSFPSEFRIPSSTLTNCRVSTSTSVTPSASTCSSVYSSGLDQYSITYPNVYTTGGSQTFIWLKFNINNPWGQTSSRIDVYIKDASSQTLQSTTFFIDYTASTMTGCSYTGSTGTTGQNTTHIVKFTPSRDLIAYSYLVITMPFWFVGTSTNNGSSGSTTLVCQGLQNTDYSSLTCSLTNSSSSDQLITINDFVSTNKTSPGEIQIKLDSLKNPFSLYPFGPIRFEIYYQSLIITQRCTGIYETATQPNNFKNLIFTIPSVQISTVNTGLSWFLGVNNPLPKNKTLIKVEYSNQITLSYLGTAFSILSQNSTQMLLTNISPTSDRISGGFSTLSVSITTPPSTRAFTFKFTALYNVSGVYYDIDTISKTFQNNAGAITSVTVAPTDTSINVVTSYTINFRLTNKMVNGGFIHIVFPSTLIVDPSAICSDNVLNTSTCIVSSNNLTISVNGSLTSGSTLTVIVDKVKNAGDSIQSGTFKIYSYYDSLSDSLIDKIETGITVTMTANLITTASVTPSNLTTYSITSYKFDFTLKDSITQNGYIQIQFPSAVVPLSGSIVLTTASFSTSTCTLSLTKSILKILNCFLSAPMNVLSTSITIGGIQNPQSFKPTDTFKIRTYSALPSLTNYISSGIIVTMNTPYQLNTFSITPLSLTVHADTKQTLNIVHVIPLNVNDYLLVNFDSSMMISNSLACNPLFGITTIMCTKISASQLKITYTAAPSSQTLRFDINTVMNYDIAQTAITFTAVLYTSDNFIKQQASTQVTYAQDTITVFSVNNDDKIILYDYSQITLTLSSPFTIGSSFDPIKTMLQIILPTGITTASNTTCTVPTGTCSIPQNTKFQVDSVGLGLTSFSIVMTNILLPYIATQSGSFSITLYYDSKKVSTVSTGVFILPYCTSPCKACSVTKTKCLSCLPSPNTLEFYNPTAFSCLNVCPDNTYPDALKICQNCVSPCSTCTDVAICSSCVASTWLSGQSCLSTCPDRFYNASNGKCQACVDPCDKCKSQTECLSCKTGFYYNFTCFAANSCPSGTYANASTLNCENCISPCASCSNSGSNCTSCVVPNLFYDGNCVLNCPNGMYPSAGNCLNCTGLCSTCLNGSYCLSCTSNFYNNGSCVIASSCPSGTFANSNNLKCDNCTSPCATCSNTATNCTSCVSPNLYYDGVCAAACPNGMYPSGNNCLNCTGLCSTCSNSTYCLTCTTNYYFNGTCVLASNCPVGTFPDSTQMKCVNCPTGCTACVSLTNCTSCNTATYIFYNDQCLTSCPDGTFKSGTSCVNCSLSCSTCQNTSTSCTGCPGGNFLYNKSCSSTCPTGLYEDVNKCTACKPQCASCQDGTSCLSCGAPFFLTPSGQCSTTCPSGKFGNSASNQCQSCTSPCTSCQLTSTNCTGCLSSLILFQGQCLSSCPSQYFNVNGSCQTCKNCNNCLSVDRCGNCSSGYFLYSQQCYTTCPNIAPIQDYTSKTCTVCDSSCLTCVGTNTNCTSCRAGLYLFNSGCLSACPSGLIGDPAKGTCDTKQISSIFYFPTLFSALAIFLILLYSKLVYRETEFITALTGLLSILCFVSWVIFLVILQLFETSINQSIITLFTIITLVVICLSVLIGVTYQVYLCFAYKNDSGLKCWIDLDTSNSIIHKVVIIGSLFTFIFYRFLFGRLFHRVYFSLSYTEGQKLLSQTHRIALLSIFTQFLPIVGISFYTVYSKQIYDQTVYSALDTLILNVIMVILLLIQGSKSGSQFFGQVAKKTSSLYETKGKYMEVDSSISVIDIDEQEVRKVKRLRTQVPQEQKDTFFRRITCIDNLNRFGHLNQFIKKEEEHSKSLPQARQLLSHPQYNINGEDEIDVVDGLFFADDNEQTYRMQKEKMIKAQQQKARQQAYKQQKARQQAYSQQRAQQQAQKQQKAKQEKQLQRSTLIQQKANLNLRKSLQAQLFHQQPSQINLITLDDKLDGPKQSQQEEQQQFHQFQQSIEINQPKNISKNNNQLIQSVPSLSRLKMQQQQRIEKQRLQKMLEDQMQQDNIECVDIVAIDKIQNKNSIKKSPLDFLNKFKTVDDKPIDQKATKKLQEMAKKNGIDPQFMKETFGVQKHHNQQLLNSIIDKHHHVNRQAVKLMFKQTNNKEVLQQLFSKNSTIDAEKLKDLMNDKNGIQMIQRLMDHQKGIISPNIAKTLLDKNSKFKPQFTKKLLSGESGADQSKIQQLLRNGDSQKTQQENLKALKKIGGDNLQNTKLIENMLGPESNLEIDQFAKVASSLSTKALQSIFNNKSPQSNKVINKILNNKKLNLKSLSTIFEDEELIYQLGKKLSGDDPILQENINNLLKNCGQNTDPQKLKEFLQNQVLVKKLMQNSVIDPQFLNQVLSKDSNSNIDLIEKTLNQMPQEDIKKIFQFTGEKNIDYKAISKIFEENSRTDPQLVKKMLDPQLVEQVFTKNNKINSNMLQKLVQKGSKFDKDNIVNIYGKNTDNFLSNRGDTIERQGKSTQRNKDSNSNRGEQKNKIPKSNSAFQMPKHKDNFSITKNQSVPQMMKNKHLPNKDLINQSKNNNEPMTFQEAIKNREIVDILKNGSKNDILKSQAFQKMVKDGSLGEMMRKTFNGKSLVSGQNGQTIDFKPNGQFIKSNPNGSKINIKPSGQTQITNSNGQIVKISKDGQITVFDKNGKVKKQGSFQQINKDGTFDQFIQNQSFRQIKQMIKNGTFNDAIKTGKLGEIIQNKALQQLIENDTLLNALNRNQSYNSKGVIFDAENIQTEYDFKMTFNKTANDNFALSQNGQVRSQQANQMIMSRTDGGMMGFLNPLKLKENKIKSKPNNNNKRDDWDDLDQRIQDLSEDQDQQEIYRTNNDEAVLQEQQDGDEEFIEKRKRKSPMKKKKQKKITDIRHPAEKIYLQPILAPHQVQSKSFRKKKKKDQSLSGIKLIMDEDNDVFDIDF